MRGLDPGGGGVPPSYNFLVLMRVWPWDAGSNMPGCGVGHCSTACALVPPNPNELQHPGRAGASGRDTAAVGKMTGAPSTGRCSLRCSKCRLAGTWTNARSGATTGAGGPTCSGRRGYALGHVPRDMCRCAVPVRTGSGVMVQWAVGQPRVRQQCVSGAEAASAVALVRSVSPLSWSRRATSVRRGC